MKLTLIFAAVWIFATCGFLIMSIFHNGWQLLRRDSAANISKGGDAPVAELFDRVRIFCFIATKPGFRDRAVAVNKTWAARCNKAIFVSSKQMAGLSVLEIPLEETRYNLWKKTSAALQYCYDNELEKFDFFLKADDDTYVIVENLRAFLENVPPSKPIAFGRKFKLNNDVTKVFLSGGAAYVLSRGALRLLFEKMGPLENNCPQYRMEDVNVGTCATAAGVEIGDSRDHLGCQRFHMLDPVASATQMKFAPWLDRYDFYPLREGKECCSTVTISYHYMNPEMMQNMDLLVYPLRSLAFLCDVEAASKLLRRTVFATEENATIGL